MSLPLSSSWAETDDRTGFNYCAPPIPSPCIDSDATYKTAASRNACRDDVGRYVQSVGAYRVCINRQTERFILKVNEDLDRYRCRSQGKGHACATGHK